MIPTRRTGAIQSLGEECGPWSEYKPGWDTVFLRMLQGYGKEISWTICSLHNGWFPWKLKPEVSAPSQGGLHFKARLETPKKAQRAAWAGVKDWLPFFWQDYSKEMKIHALFGPICCTSLRSPSEVVGNNRTPSQTKAKHHWKIIPRKPTSFRHSTQPARAASVKIKKNQETQKHINKNMKNPKK